MSGLATLSLLALSIILHELAHYISARKSGVAVSEFFIGFGPKIFSLRKGNTEYGVKAILLGGYVKIPGMDQEEDVTNDFQEGELYHTASWQTKLLISSSGILMNIFLAFIIMNVVLGISGITYPTLQIESLAASVDEDVKPASYYAGLKPGDTIYSFNDEVLENWEQLVGFIEDNPNKKVSISYLRDQKMYYTSITLDEKIVNGESLGYLGVAPKINSEKLTIFKIVTSSFIIILNMISSSIAGIFTLLSPTNLATLAGGLFGNPVPADIRPLSPIGLAQAGQIIGDSGFVNLLTLLAFVNVFLAIFNSIPLLPLDGGRVILSLLEGVTGRKVSDRKLYPLAAIVVLLFLFLGITALFLDITQPIKL